MRANLHRLVFLLCLCLWATSAGAAVTVSFVHPEDYTDIGTYRGEPNAAMKEIAAFLKQLGARYLPPGQLLKIQVLDVNLAGSLRYSSRAPFGVRILRGEADWPSVRLHYVLEQDGRILADRQEYIADVDYLEHPAGPYSDEPLSYEKQMLDHWFRLRFQAHQR
ncbi:MAG: DUF3016 domain-containing protein [Burkholderiales bacterium]